MNKDFTYCNSKDCIHRRGCRRWILNYRVKHFEDIGNIYFLNDEDCINSTPYPFSELVRFRNSNEDGAVL